MQCSETGNLHVTHDILSRTTVAHDIMTIGKLILLIQLNNAKKKKKKLCKIKLPSYFSVWVMFHSLVSLWQKKKIIIIVAQVFADWLMLGLFFLYFTGISHLIIPPSLSYVIPKVYGHLYCRLHCLKTYSLGAFDIIFKCQSHHDHQRQRGSYNGGPQSQKSHMPVESSVRCSGVYVPSSGHFRLDVQTKVFSFFFFNKLYYYLTYSWKIHPTKTHLDSVTGDQPVLFF